MSSNAYSSELRPEPRLRRAVLAGGALLIVAGCLLVGLLPVTGGRKLLLGLSWLLVSGYEYVSHWRAYTREGILRLDSNGQVWRSSHGKQFDAVVLSGGSIVTSRIAWLRISVGRGCRYGELLHGDARESEDWRRFQVIWRHIGANL